MRMKGGTIMQNKQYTIGEFASMNKVSTRMLRHYDKIGLLPPDCILPNGYRCYHEEQIGRLSQIKHLRDCGFLLDEIHEILENDNPQFLVNAAKCKLAQLQDQAVQYQNAIQLLGALMQESRGLTHPPVYGVSRSTRLGTNLLIPNQTFAIDKVEDAFEGLFRLLHQKKLRTTSCSVLLNDMNDQAEEQYRVGVPIFETYDDQDHQTLSLPPTSVLSVIHYGDYYTIGHAYSALLNYTEQYAYAITGTVMERYFIDHSHTLSSNEYVTEISIAFKNTP